MGIRLYTGDKVNPKNLYFEDLELVTNIINHTLEQLYEDYEKHCINANIEPMTMDEFDKKIKVDYEVKDKYIETLGFVGTVYVVKQFKRRGR